MLRLFKMPQVDIDRARQDIMVVTGRGMNCFDFYLVDEATEIQRSNLSRIPSEWQSQGLN